MKRIKTTILACSGALLIFIILVYTYGAISKMLMDEVSGRMREYSQNETTYVKYLFNQEMQSLRTGARFISENPSYTREEIVQLLIELRKTTHFYRILVAQPNGVSITDNDDLANVLERSYFQAAINGKSTISERMTFFDKNNEGIVLAVPIYRDGKIIGILAGAHTRQSLDNSFSTQIFGGEAYCIITDKEGEIILFTPTKHKLITTGNLFTFYRQVTFSGKENPEDLKSRFENGLEGLFEFSFKGQKRLVHYKPLGIHNWMILSAVSPDAAFKLNKYLFSFVTVQLVLLAGIFSALLVYVLFSFRKKNTLLTAIAQGREIINHAIPGGVVKTETEKGFPILYKSKGFYELSGFTEEEIRTNFENKLTNFIHPEDLKDAMEGFSWQTESGSHILQYRFCTKNGYIWIYDSGRIIRDADNTSVQVSVLIDMTRIKNSLDSLRIRAEHDPATELYNKAAIRTYTEAVLTGNRRESDLHALVIIDIDDFKHINDTYGHQTGDQTIIQFADCIKKEIRKTDLAGRIGGDEFMIFLTHVPDKTFVEEFLEQLGESIRNIHFEDGYNLSCSLGAALFPAHGDSYDVLYKKADSALYRAKQRGKNCFEIHSP